MSKKIYLHWYRNEKVGPNFGDEITTYIIERLSDSKVCYVPIPATPLKMIVRGTRSFFKGQINLKTLFQSFRSAIAGKYVLGAGSILGWCSGPNAIVWGSGIIKKTDPIQPSEFKAVRGKYTQNRLKELGLQAPEVIGDPALLLPKVYTSGAEKKYKLGIIAHYTHNTFFKQYAAIEGLLIINLLNEIETVIDQINSCEHTISTSLHGVVVSHAYNVPSLWYSISGKKLGGDDVKFLDYFSSVNIENYTPIEMPTFEDFKIENILKKFEEYKNVAVLHADLDVIANQLIGVAPFEVKQKYK
jgi:pyruvyltransferase